MKKIRPIFAFLYYSFLIGILHCVNVFYFDCGKVCDKFWHILYSLLYYFGFCTLGTIFIDCGTMFSEIYYFMFVFCFSTIQIKWLLRTIFLVVSNLWLLFAWHFFPFQLPSFFANEYQFLFLWWVLVPLIIYFSILLFYFYRYYQSHSFAIKAIY